MKNFFKLTSLQRKVLAQTLYVVVLFTLLVSLFHYRVAFTKADAFTFKKFLDNPKKYDGLVVSVMGPYGGSFPGGFFVIHNKLPIKVYYEPFHDAPRIGEVLARGTLQVDGTLYAKQVHNYDYNYLWYALSFLTGMVVLIYFLKEWKCTLRGFEERA